MSLIWTCGGWLTMYKIALATSSPAKSGPKVSLKCCTISLISCDALEYQLPCIGVYRQPSFVTETNGNRWEHDFHHGTKSNIHRPGSYRFFPVVHTTAGKRQRTCRLFSVCPIRPTAGSYFYAHQEVCWHRGQLDRQPIAHPRANGLGNVARPGHWNLERLRPSVPCFSWPLEQSLCSIARQPD